MKKITNFDIYLVSNKASVFVYRDIKCQRSYYSNHGSVPENKQWVTFKIHCVQFGPESQILEALMK